MAAGAGTGISLLPGGPAQAAVPALVSANQLWAWNRMLAGLGPRLTGNAAHAHFIDWLADQWERTGMKVHRDRLTFTRWAPKRWSLSVEGAPVDVAFYFPYSGMTPPGGVTGKLIHLGVSPLNALGWAAAKGKIAVVEVVTPPIPIAVGFPPTGYYPKNMAAPSLTTTQPAIADIVTAPLLELAAKAGVLGVICIRTGVSDDLAKDQYSPFTTAYQGCPALWLGPTAGKKVRAQALRGATATLTLDASLIRGAATETIWAVLPGSQPKEAVVVNTHTDGPNVAEENGGLGLLALARQMAKVPKSQRRRSLIFVATTGHFQLPQFQATHSPLGVGGGQSASRWLAMHPERVNGVRSKAVAALTLEHLGCMEWEDDPAHTAYRATGRKDVGFCYTTTAAMRKAYLAAAVGTANTRTVTALPVPELYFGEGHDFYAAKIATASLIPAQSYLVAAPRGGALEKLDRYYMRGQIQTFSKLIRRLESLSAKQIGTPLGL